MPEPSSEDRRAAEAEGLWGHIAGLLAAQLAYLRARIELAGIEGRAAALHYGIALGLAVGALLLVIFGYFFFVLTLVFAIAWACGGGNAWIWVLLGAALLHFAGTAALLFIARKKVVQPMFAATLGEFRKDQAWLTTGKQN